MNEKVINTKIDFQMKSRGLKMTTENINPANRNIKIVRIGATTPRVKSSGLNEVLFYEEIVYQSVYDFIDDPEMDQVVSIKFDWRNAKSWEIDKLEKKLRENAIRVYGERDKIYEFYSIVY